MADLELERAALIGLLRTSKARSMSWSRVVAMVLEADSALAVWSEVDQPSLLENDADDAIREAREVIADWDRAGDQFVTVLDADYPAQLREIQEAPPFLFHRGALRPADPAVSVVGSRKASPRGLEISASLATHLVGAGLTVVAGLAEGIDTAAHQSALDAGGRTVAVIGTGIRRYYPAPNRDLQDVISQRGLVLSQYYPDASPRPNHFRQRNATMSGYGIATIVVEAGETSGARIQARVAVEHGRPVILTDMVMHNEWAQALEGQPGVHVATSANEVMAIIDSIRQEPSVLLEAAASLTQ